MNIEEVVYRDNINNRLTMTPTRCTIKYNNEIPVEQLFEVAEKEYLLYIQNNCTKTIRGRIEEYKGLVRFHIEAKYKSNCTWR